jgi:hypothetical protein
MIFSGSKHKNGVLVFLQQQQQKEMFYCRFPNNHPSLILPLFS